MKRKEKKEKENEEQKKGQRDKPVSSFLSFFFFFFSLFRFIGDGKPFLLAFLRNSYLQWDETKGMGGEEQRSEGGEGRW